MKQQEKNTNNSVDRMKEITDMLEAGIKNLFESEKFKEYLNVMSKFHDYSLNNTLLIAMQKPEATLVAGYNSWKNDFDRRVKKDEKGIRIFAPTPYKKEVEVEKIDKTTGEVLKNPDGTPQKEVKEILVPKYKIVSVFDVSQTEGKELPQLGVSELTGEVEQYKHFFAALEKVSPVPIGFEKIENGSHGYYHTVEKRIAIAEGMSELQTLKTAVHEIAHARLHDIDNAAETETAAKKDRFTKEVEAESVAYTVCQHYGLDTSDYSFAYVAGWSSSKELPELKNSLETIRSAANEIISDIDKHLIELQRVNGTEVGMNNTIILLEGYRRMSNQEYQKFTKGDTIWGIDSDGKEIRRWNIDQETEAKEELEKYRCDYSKGIDVWDATEYALMYCECDENGEFIQGADYYLAEEKTEIEEKIAVPSHKPHYTKEEYEYAKGVNVLNYLMEKGEAFTKEGASYCRSKDYSSLVIRQDGQWSWNKRDLHGRSPVTLVSLLLQEKNNYGEKEAYIAAVKELAAYAGYQQETAAQNQRFQQQTQQAQQMQAVPEKKELQMPVKSKSFKNAIAYLCITRKIDYDIVKKLIGEKKIIQEEKTNNVGFIAYDDEKNPRHIFLRGTLSDKSFKKDVPGSDKTYPFVFGGADDSKRVFVFEAAIDSLSHATLTKMCGKKPEQDFRISLNGVSNEGLDYFLKNHPQVKDVFVCTDNDEAGNKCAEKIKEKYGEDYNIVRQTPAKGKDWNECLVEEVTQVEVSEEKVVEFER